MNNSLKIPTFQYISGRPSIYLKDILTKSNRHKNVFPINQERCYFFFSARYALAIGIKLLEIGPDDAVLLPSYNCGVEIDPIIHLGIKPVFYKINKNLLIDFDDLLNKITEKVKAIMVTHFLGFPQPIDEIKKICIEKKLFLIEDCAHAFLSTHNEEYLGSYGDVSIFSLLKTLPVPNGGILLINNKNIIYNHNLKKPNLFSTFFYTAELLRQRTDKNNNSIKENVGKFLYNGLFISLSSLRLFLVGFRKYFNPKALYLMRPDSYLFIEALCSWGISGLSKNIMNGSDFEKIKIIRRRNFEYLLNYFVKNERGILPLKKLPDGVCPLFLPIILESSGKRDRLYRTLKNRGITTHPWWDKFHTEVPWDEFPDAVYLKKRLFGIPIHQDLSFIHLDQIINEFEKAYKQI